MATRIYLPSSGAAAVTPTNWLIAPHANNYTYAGVTTKISSAFANRTAAVGTSSAYANSVVRYVFGPIAAGNVSGTVEAVVRCYENNAQANATLNLGVHIIQPDGSNRATLLASTHSDSAASPYEFTTTLSTRRAHTTAEARPPTLTEQAASNGDYLVIELGYYRVGGTNNRSTSINVGDNNANDCPNNDSDANAFAPWVEFSQNILRYYAPIAANEGTYAVTGSDVTLALLVSKTLSVDPGSANITGTDSILDFVASANAGVLAVTGADATLTKLSFYSMSADAGAYAVTGAAATPTYQFKLDTGVGAYTTSGQAVALKPGFVSEAGAGTYAVSGKDAELKAAVIMAAGAGAYATSGEGATLTKLNAYSLSVDPGAYAVGGEAVTLTKIGASEIAAEAGAYAVAGAAVSLSSDKIYDTGTYAVTGEDAVLTFGEAAIVLSVDPGTYVVSGTESESLQNKTLDAGAGAHAVTGESSTLAKINFYSMSVDAGTYAVAGSSIEFHKDKIFSVDAGTYALAGVAVNALYARIMAASGTTYAITGIAADTLHKRVIEIGGGAHALAGSDVNLNAGGDKAITASAGVYTLAGVSLGTLIARYLEVTPGTYAVSGAMVQALKAAILATEAGAYTETGSAVEILCNRLAGAGAGTYALTGADIEFLKTWKIDVVGGVYTMTGLAASLDWAASVVHPLIIRVQDRKLIAEIEKRVRTVRVADRSKIADIEKRR